MQINIFGLGYVGCVSAACLARMGHTIIGVDVNPQKVGWINQGRSPVAEAGLNEMIGEAVRSGCLQATLDAQQAVLQSEISIVCVGTPADTENGQDLTYIRRVCQQVGKALAVKADYHIVVIRSTVLPGATENVVVPILEHHSGKRVGVDFGVVMNPEFLREGSAVEDFFHPPFVVLGEVGGGAAGMLKELYREIPAPVFTTDVRTAEMIKYTCNAFHALKITFANEIGNLSQKFGIDGREVMRIFVQDSVLNLSPAYLRPGFAFGGSCLPKDLQTLLHQAGQKRVSLPVLEAILPSNEAQIMRGVALVTDTKKNRIGVVGLSFKEGTDDLRESTVVKMVRALLDQGLTIQVFDENVNADLLLGANREFIERELPELSSVLKCSLEPVITWSEVLVLTQRINRDWGVLANMIRDDQVVIDLVGQEEMRVLGKGKYVGICW